MKFLVLVVLALLICFHFVFWPQAYAQVRHDKLFSVIDIILSIVNVVLSLIVFFNTEDPIQPSKYAPWLVFVVAQLIFVGAWLAQYKVDSAAGIAPKTTYTNQKPHSYVSDINFSRCVFLRSARSGG